MRDTAPHPFIFQYIFKRLFFLNMLLCALLGVSDSPNAGHWCWRMQRARVQAGCGHAVKHIENHLNGGGMASAKPLLLQGPMRKGLLTKILQLIDRLN